MDKSFCAHWNQLFKSLSIDTKFEHMSSMEIPTTGHELRLLQLYIVLD